MDVNQIVVTVLGLALIAGVLVFFFGPKKPPTRTATRPATPGTRD
jgi:hypothetical protein